MVALAPPLTRVVQRTFAAAPMHYTGPVEMLVAECVPESDEVGQLSLAAMRQIAALLDESGSNVRITIGNTNSPPRPVLRW
jgi:hypothetical protein